MKKQNVLGLVLATSLALTSLAGCQVPGMTGQTSSGTNATSNQQQPTGGQNATAQQPTKTETREGAAEALAEEREMDDMDYAAGESTAAGYAVAMVGGPKAARGEVAITAEGGAGGAEAEAGATTEAEASTGDRKGDRKADRQGERTERRQARREAFKGKLKAEVRAQIEQRLEARKAKVEARLAKIKGAADKVRAKAKGAAWVDNGDGTETKTISVGVDATVNGKAASKSFEMSRTRNAETKVLMSSSVKRTMTLPSGGSRSAERTKTLNEDGTYTVVFHAEHVFADGSKRVADWTKTIALDGTVSGTGTIVWTDKDGNEVKKTEVTLGGSEDAPAAEAAGEEVTADAPEAAVGTEANAEAEADATTEAKVEDGEASATTEAEVEAEAGATAEAEATN